MMLSAPPLTHVRIGISVARTHAEATGSGSATVKRLDRGASAHALAYGTYRWREDMADLIGQTVGEYRIEATIGGTSEITLVGRRTIPCVVRL